ncbi:hypothetical protein ACFWC6_33160, partial [Micromonospora chalcea]
RMALALKAVFLILQVSIGSVAVTLNVLVETFEWLAKTTPWLSGKYKELKGSQDGAKTSAYDLAGGFKALGTDANAAASGITSLKEKADELVGNNISLREATIGAKNAIADTAKVLKENGEAHGFNSRKGRENETALNNLATAFNAEADAGERSGISAAEASDKYHTNRAKLVAMAEKAGYSKREADKLAGALLKVPKNVDTDINADTADALEKLKTFQKRIDGLTGKTVTVRVTSKGDHYIPGVGTQLKGFSAGGVASFIDGTAGTFRTGGPTEVTSNINLTSTLNLDGQVLARFVDRRVEQAMQRQATRTRAGRR